MCLRYFHRLVTLQLYSYHVVTYHVTSTPVSPFSRKSAGGIIEQFAVFAVDWRDRVPASVVCLTHTKNLITLFHQKHDRPCVCYVQDFSSDPCKVSHDCVDLCSLAGLNAWMV